MSEFDFTFRGESLSSHGYMICEFDSSSSASAVTTDSQKEISSVSMFNGKYQPIIYSNYASALTMELSICKIDGDNYYLTPQERVEIKRWLGCPYPCEFRLSDSKYDGYFWNGVFNVEEVRTPLGCVGFNLTFTATAPFGYKDKVEISGSVSANGAVTIKDTSDEEGYIYPDIEVTLQSAGTLKITNAFDNRATVVYNCLSGETLTFSHLLQIATDSSSHSLGDNFNYKFVRINNTYGKTQNTLTFSLPCTYKISYTPIAKVVI